MLLPGGESGVGGSGCYIPSAEKDAFPFHTPSIWHIHISQIPYTPRPQRLQMQWLGYMLQTPRKTKQNKTLCHWGAFGGKIVKANKQRLI